MRFLVLATQLDNVKKDTFIQPFGVTAIFGGWIDKSLIIGCALDETVQHHPTSVLRVCLKIARFVTRLARGPVKLLRQLVLSCGTEAQYSVGSSGIWASDLQHLRASGRRSSQLSYLLFPMQFWRVTNWPQQEIKPGLPETCLGLPWDSLVVDASSGLLACLQILPRVSSASYKTKSDQIHNILHSSEDNSIVKHIKCTLTILLARGEDSGNQRKGGCATYNT